MKAQVFYETEKMEFMERDIPKISDDEALLKVHACGICGSDLAYYFGKSPLETENGKGPLVLGHEFTGEIVELGSKIRNQKLFSIGDRVVANPVQHCNTCKYCHKGYFNLCEKPSTCGVSVDGAFAEYVKIRASNLLKLSENITYEEAALIEPLSCSTYSVRNAEINIGDFVVIFGPGPIGLMMVQLAKAMGAGKVALVGRRDFPLKVGRDVGADYIINVKDQKSEFYSENVVQRINDLTNGFLADRVLVATASLEAAQEAINVSGKKSLIVFFGLGGPEDILHVPMLQTLTSDKRFVFSWLAPRVWPYALQALDSGQVKLDKIITHKFPLSELSTAFNFMSGDYSEKLKAVITY